jgi:predicted Zn finger-like uncharacterized protein
MNVTCPNCATVYRVDPAKVPDGGVRARCSICSAVFAVRRDNEPQERPASVPAAAGAQGAAQPVPPSHVAAALTAPAGWSPPSAAPATPAAPPAPRESIRPPMPPVAAPSSAPSTAPPTPTPPPPATQPAATRSPSHSPPAMPMSAPRPAGPSAPAVPRPAAAVPPATPAPQAPPAVNAPAPAPMPPRPAAAPGSRPVNPFLSQDPALKARRLARALISDMVVYHPAKRQEGLRDGNLKELFEDEIKKSWEEYGEQVGKDVAESTPYFREALNEILAGGRQIF